ncbi:MAG: GGDEF domain-containing protein, partial [Intestinibacillus sp.]
FVFGSREHLREGLKPILLPVAVNLVLSPASIFTDIYFVLDADNVYHRGRFMLALLGICLYIIAYTTFFLIRHRKKLKPKELFFMLFFAVPPSIGGAVQAFHYGAVLLWPCVTLSILMIFINLQNNQLVTDYLTGLYNRRYLDSYLESRLKSGAGERWLAGVMIDLNAFKQINDLYGHGSGDQALRNTAALLKKTFRKGAIIARYGGDEFVVVLELRSPRQLPARIKALRENVGLWNLQNTEPYSISLSIGYDTIAKGSAMATPEFLAHIDHLMYLDKQSQICRP